jgi:FkbM family methyltransferase
MSANSEDVTIFDHFFNSPEFMDKNHTYMEIGAHDGVRESNSRFYDVCLGWKGLLVEPHPKNYERTVQLRPNAHHLNVAPSCLANATGTVSFPEHLYTSAQVNEEGSKLEIHCGPLQHYLDALSIHHIDFWSLDVEGQEMNVLKTVDFERTHIEVIIAESENRLSGTPEFEQKVKDVRTFLQSKGYLMLGSVHVFKSDVFLNKRACHRHPNVDECKEVMSRMRR